MFWAILKYVTIDVKTIGQLLKNIGLLFIPSSGHTDPTTYHYVVEGQSINE